MSQDRFDIHQHITDQIISAIEDGAGEFRLPWHRAGSVSRPTNIASGNAYQGINVLALWAAAHTSGFTTGVWGTYRQWAAAGAQVRRGEKAAHVVFYKQLTSASADDTGDDANATRLFARATPVFASEQVDGLVSAQDPASARIDPIVAADALIQASRAVIRHGGARAYYQPSEDIIQLPNQADFVGTATSTPQESYYATLLHELLHWTSPAHRCDRQLGKRFGDDDYAMEELIAELGAAFLCADLGVTVEPRADHAQYLASWLNVLKADKKAIFTAASQGSKATAWLLKLQDTGA